MLKNTITEQILDSSHKNALIKELSEEKEKNKILTEALEKIVESINATGLKFVDIQNPLHIALYTSLHLAKAALVKIK